MVEGNDEKLLELTGLSHDDKLIDLAISLTKNGWYVEGDSGTEHEWVIFEIEDPSKEALQKQLKDLGLPDAYITEVLSHF